MRMSQQATIAVFVVLVMVAAAAGLWHAWQRGTQAQNKLRDQRSAQRARYALAKTLPEVLAPSGGPLAKQTFGRR